MGGKNSSGVKKDECFVSQGKSLRNHLIRICTTEATDYDLIGDIVLNLCIPHHPHISKIKGDEYIPSLKPD